MWEKIFTATAIVGVGVGSFGLVNAVLDTIGEATPLKMRIGEKVLTEYLKTASEDDRRHADTISSIQQRIISRKI